MKALLINPSYPQTFWSFNRVLKMLNKKCVQPPLGLLTLAALLPHDWDLKLGDLAVGRIPDRWWDECDIVFVTGLITQYSGILDAIRGAKRRGKQVVAGGPCVFHVPEDAFAAGADIVVKGEAEGVMDRLLSAIRNKETGIVIQAAGRPTLADSPPPRYDLLNPNQYVDLSIQFSRGCPFQCEFCDITLMFGRKVRSKTPEQIIRELENIHNLGWRRGVFFVDDNFIGNPVKAKALLKELVPWMRAHGNPFEFNTQASVNLAADPELMELMADAGFWKVFLGIETTDLDCLKETRKFQNAAVDLDEVCSKMNRAGLQVIAGCILGFDHELAGADERLIGFANRNNIPEMFITLLQAGPGTDLWVRLEKEGRLRHEGFDNRFGNQTGFPNFETSRPGKEIANEFINLYKVLYEPNAYLDRVFHYIAEMPPPPKRTSATAPYVSEIRASVIALFKQGVIYPSRMKFWKYLFEVMTKFPERSRTFFSAMILAEHYNDYRATIQEQIETRLLEMAAQIREADKSGRSADASV